MTKRRVEVQNMGRIKLPTIIRSKLGVDAGDEVDIEYRNGKVIITKVVESSTQ